MTRLTFIITVFCLLLFLGPAVNGATLSGTDLSLVSSGPSGTMDIRLDQASTGLAGYQLEITINPAGIAQVSAVNFPAAFGMNSASTIPASTVSIVAVDLMDQVPVGATNIILASLGFTGLTDGTADVEITVTELTDDSGDPISVTASGPHIVVGSATPTVAPTAAPTTGPTEVPTTVPATAVPTEVPTVEPTVIPTNEPNQIPNTNNETFVAGFTAIPMTGTPPLSVNFTDHSTGSPKKWRWDFGDGTLSTLQNPTHVYGGIGRYTVTLEAISDNYSSVERKPEIIRPALDYPTGPSGFVMVTSQPSGAGVYMIRNVGERYLGTTPATLIVPAGSRSLSFQKEGYQNKTVSVTIRPDEMKLIPKVMLKAAS